MTPQDAVAECRRAREIAGARWPVPLITYLDSPRASRAFDWLCSCVDRLLDFPGRASAEFKEAVSWARQQAADGPDREAIEWTAWGFWARRSPEAPEVTAVAQLLFALARSDPSDRFSFAGACSTPICLFEKLESEPGEVLEQVLTHFSEYVGGEDAQRGMATNRPAAGR